MPFSPNTPTVNKGTKQAVIIAKTINIIQFMENKMGTKIKKKRSIPITIKVPQNSVSWNFAMAIVPKNYDVMLLTLSYGLNIMR